MKVKIRVTALLICILTLLSLCPAVSAAEEKIKLADIDFKGFEIENFKSDTTYYLCYPASFEDISVTNLRANIAANYDIRVERYCDYEKKVSYNMKETMNLGYGRARVTVTVTSQTDPENTQSYLFALTDPKQSTYRYRYFTAATPIYETPSEKGTLITTLKKGTTYSSMPLCIEEKEGWTRIVIPSSSSKHHGKVGWVKTENLVEEYPATENAKAYIEAVTALQKAHPKWTFEYRYMGTDMDDYAQRLMDLYNKNATDTTDVNTVLNNMDPLNFLDEKNVFMFLDIARYDATHYTASGIRSIWNENAVNNKTKEKADISEDQAVDYISNAGKSLTVNTYFIAVRAALESGHGTSPFAKGTVKGYEGYMNFFGIRCEDKNPEKGAAYAQSRGWDSPFRSIVEGANWLTDQYIHRGQNTPYFFRYYPYTDHHIYMSDLKAPQKDAANLYKCYKNGGTLDSALHFIIPIYETRYNDVAPKAWYYEDVYRATEYGLFEGMDNGGFAPGGTLTRAQFVTVLSRIAGANVKGMSTEQFTDVPKKAWYMGYVAWGYDSGITKGISETAFGPERAITRQELCTMLVRYAFSQEIELTEGELSFTDKKSIASWAKDGVSYCVGEGLVNGMPDGTFAPEKSATRAQGAKILSLFYENRVLARSEANAE